MLGEDRRQQHLLPLRLQKRSKISRDFDHCVLFEIESRETIFFREKDVRIVFVELENWKDEGEREREMYTEALMKGLIWAR